MQLSSRKSWGRIGMLLPILPTFALSQEHLPSLARRKPTTKVESQISAGIQERRSSLHRVGRLRSLIRAKKRRYRIEKFQNFSITQELGLTHVYILLYGETACWLQSAMPVPLGPLGSSEVVRSVSLKVLFRDVYILCQNLIDLVN